MIVGPVGNLGKCDIMDQGDIRHLVTTSLEGVQETLHLDFSLSSPDTSVMESLSRSWVVNDIAG